LGIGYNKDIMAEFGEQQESSGKHQNIELKPIVEVESTHIEAIVQADKVKVVKPAVSLPSTLSREAVFGENMPRPDIMPNSYKGLHVIGVPKHIPFGALHLGGRIYLKHSIFKDFQSENPGPETLAILEHEHTHFERIGNGIKDQVFKFWTRPEYRFQEELAAQRSEAIVLKQHGLPKESFKIEQRARFLSGPLYLWCTNYTTAKRELENVWDKAGT
jgi:hypothetical protein